MDLSNSHCHILSGLKNVGSYRYQFIKTIDSLCQLLERIKYHINNGNIILYACTLHI